MIRRQQGCTGPAELLDTNWVSETRPTIRTESGLGDRWPVGTSNKFQDGPPWPTEGARPGFTDTFFHACSLSSASLVVPASSQEAG